MAFGHQGAGKNVAMKQIKFANDLVSKILEGSKTATWRLFDDKALQIGDQLEF